MKNSKKGPSPATSTFWNTLTTIGEIFTEFAKGLGSGTGIDDDETLQTKTITKPAPTKENIPTAKAIIVPVAIPLTEATIVNSLDASTQTSRPSSPQQQMIDSLKKNLAQGPTLRKTTATSKQFNAPDLEQITTPIASRKTALSDQKEKILEATNSLKELEKATPELLSVDISNYHNLTPEEIISGNLITAAAQQRNLEAANVMAKVLSSSTIAGADIALKNGLTAVIKAYPAIKEEVNIARNKALSEQNLIKDKYQKIQNLITSDPIAIEAISTLPPY
jgi:hypothetical protein